MALHGEIEVNSFPIGEWWAVRKEQVNDSKDDPKFVYQCGVHIYDRWKDGKVEFSLVHRYTEGALVLTSKVTAEAAKIMQQSTKWRG